MQVKNEESLLLLATYTKYSRKTHSQTFSTTQVGQPPQPPLILVKSPDFWYTLGFVNYYLGTKTKK